MSARPGLGWWAAALGVLLGAGPSLAKPGTPGPAYFAGTYERVGRGPAPEFRPINDLVALSAGRAGLGMVLHSCGQAPIFLSFGPAHEIENLMQGSVEGVGLDCLFDDNGYLRPILTCRSKDGGAFALWPFGQGEELSCP